jgi:hypothetical protein
MLRQMALKHTEYQCVRLSLRWCQRESRTRRGKVRTDPMLPMGAVSTTACSGRQFTAHGSNFYIGATVAAWT